MKFVYFFAISCVVCLFICYKIEDNACSPSKNRARKDTVTVRRNKNNSLNKNDVNLIKLIDREWQINKTETDNNKLPSFIMDQFEHIETGGDRNDIIIRFCFNTETKNGTGIFKFNLGDVYITEKVVDSELYIYSNPSEDSIENHGSGPFTVRLYQIVSNEALNISNLNPDFHKLLTVAYVPKIKRGWQVFKVKSAVENWLKHDPNLGLLFIATNVLGNRVYPDFVSKYIKTGLYRTFLMITFKKSLTHQYPPNVKIPTDNGANIELYDAHNGCSRKLWEINFHKSGWHFIIKPASLMAYKCSGSCSIAPNSFFNQYGHLLNFFRKQSHNESYSCCVPVTFSSATIMFYDYFDNVVIKVYDNMVVEKCGCR